MVESVELKGNREDGYRLVHREWDGYDKPEYTTICNLTTDETDCLVQTGYLHADKDQLTFLTATDPHGYLRIGDIDALRDMDAQEDSLAPVMITGLIVSLPPNDTLSRERIEFCDPTHKNINSKPAAAFLEPFWEKHLQKDGQSDIDEDEFWPDNPAECNAFW